MEITTLKNGIRLVTEHMPSLRSVSLGIWTKNGSRHETEALNGVSHFIEHMLFKGTSKRSAKDIADEMDAMGGQMNAFTAKEYTCYYTRSLDNHFARSLDVLADMFFNSVFDQNEINKEKNVIIEEINMYEDSPDDVVAEILNKAVWDGYALGRNILGTKETVSSFTTDIFKTYMARRYAPENIVVSVAGSFDKAEVVSLVEAYFGQHTTSGDPGGIITPTYKPSIISKHKDIEQINIQLAVPSINLLDDNIYAMGALNTILGGGMSSRLFQSVREQRGLCYSIYSYNSAHEDVGLFSICSSLTKENTKEAISCIVDEFKALGTNKITQDQLDRTKEQLKSNYILGLESSSARMNAIGRGVIMTNKAQTPEIIIEKINSITLDKVYDVYNTISDLSKLSLSVVGNLDGLDVDKLLSDAL